MHIVEYTGPGFRRNGVYSSGRLTQRVRMKLGLGLYRHHLDRDHFRFARQCGATHVVAHLVDYFNGRADAASDNQPVGGDRGWGLAGNPNVLWTEAELAALRRGIESEGLVLAAIENLDPAHWHDILLDGPERGRQIENVKTLIRRLGAAGVPVLGYNFSLAGVAGRVSAPVARGQALSVGMERVDDRPLPAGMVWNMVYDPQAKLATLPPVSADEVWRRHERFLDEVLPVAEKAGVKLALHPDDPPVPELRRTGRLVYQPHLYQKIIDRHSSPAFALEFCVGSIAEMTEGNVYEAVERYGRQQRIAYVHLRNVRGKAPRYWETFLDDGEVDMLRVLRTLKRTGFEGVIIPDHTPQLTCAAPWHAGMAHALGWIGAALKGLG